MGDFNKPRQNRPRPRLCAVATASLPSEHLGWLLKRRILLCRRLIRPPRILRRLIWLLHPSLYLIPPHLQFLFKIFPAFSKFVHSLRPPPRPTPNVFCFA